jgi:putative copper export protein/methionine-rich copper-binding protein CopC
MGGMTVNPWRIGALIAGVTLGVLGTFAGPAGPASAHASLVRTSPVQGSVATNAPSQVVITFSEPVSLVADKIEVLGPDGRRIDKRQARVSRDQVLVPVRTDVPRGTYLVSYRVISADSHPVGGGFTYSVGAPSTSGPPKLGDAARTDPVVNTGVSIARYLGFLGLIIVVGPALILYALWPARLDRRRPTRLVQAGLGLVALATLAELYLQAPYSTGGGPFDASFGDLRDVLGSRYGQAHLVRLAILAVSALLLRPLLAGRSGRFDRALLVVLGVIGVGTWSVAGHPGASSAPALTVVADVAHLSSVAVWLGGLIMLIGFPGWRGLLRAANARELRAILPVWSGWATLAVTVLVLAGTAQALVQIGTVGALFGTTYGRLVLLKVGVLAVVLAVAAMSRALVQRHAGMAGGRAGVGSGGAPADADLAEPDLAESDLAGSALAGSTLARPGSGGGEPAAYGGEPSAYGGGEPSAYGGGEPSAAPVGSGRQVVAMADKGPAASGARINGTMIEGTGTDGAAMDARHPTGDGPGAGGDGPNGGGDGPGGADDGSGGGGAGGGPAGEGRGALRRLRRSVIAEIVGAAVILGLTAALVQTTPGHTAASAASQAAGPFSAVLTSPLYQVQIDVDPARTGNNEVHLYASAPNGGPVKVLEWKATAALPARGLEPVTIPLLVITDSHATGEVSLTTPGTWQISLTLRTTAIDEATVTADVTVR